MSNLTFYERQQIESCLKSGFKIKLISVFVGRDHSVISREINRNSGDYFPYDARVAQEAADRRAKKTNKRKMDKNPALKKYVCENLKKGWSPEQIAGRISEHHPPELHGATISYEQIYEYVYDDGRDENGLPLYKFLRKKKIQRQKRYSRKKRNITILERRSIHERAEEINTKATYGHWESDTMICKYRKGLSVQYERKSQLVRVQKLDNLKAETTEQVIIGNIESLPIYLRQSMTFDNGTENAKHMNIRDNLELDTYFCDTYSAWQKGGVENMNGLLREYLPKKINLEEIDGKTIYDIQERLNNRPRKSLKYSTPNEIINIQIGALNS